MTRTKKYIVKIEQSCEEKYPVSYRLTEEEFSNIVEEANK